MMMRRRLPLRLPSAELVPSSSLQVGRSCLRLSCGRVGQGGQGVSRLGEPILQCLHDRPFHAEAVC